MSAYRSTRRRWPIAAMVAGSLASFATSTAVFAVIRHDGWRGVIAAALAVGAVVAWRKSKPNEPISNRRDQA